MIRRLLAAAVLALLPACGRDDGDRTLRDAAAWLWSRQRADGSWRSDRYAVLRSGQALTPFVLDALLRVPDEVAPPPPGGVDRALAFLRSRVDAEGALGYGDPELLEYPVYATSYALRCFVRAGRPSDGALVERMAAWLAGRQHGPGDGFGSDRPACGGWPFGEVGLPPGDPGHVDLSHTRRALEALAAAGRLDGPARAAALAFLDHVRDARDGGFHSSAVVPPANKGGVGEGGTFGSYATATADGLLALLAAGVPRGDPRVEGAARWLAGHPHLTWPQGIPGASPWGAALFFGHVAVRAEAAAALGGDAAMHARIVELLAARQDDDGSFTNRASPLQKEDEPLLATAHVVVALCARGCVQQPSTISISQAALAR